MQTAYTIDQLSEIFGGPPVQRGLSAQVSYLLTDSRAVQAAAHSLFFAIVGSRRDGHQYLGELYKKGVRCFVVSRADSFAGLPQANVWLAEDATAALQQLAAAHRRRFALPVIGITGSNGKTIVKEWLFQLLHQDYRIVRSPKSYNSQIGVPLSVWQLLPEHELAIFEAGISQLGEMEKLAPIIRCNIGLLTNIGEAHQEGFPSRAVKLSEKLRLFEGAEVLIYCCDDEQVAQAVRALGQACLSWSRRSCADLQVLQCEMTADATQLAVLYQGRRLDFHIPFADEISIENALHCLAVMLYLGVPDAQISARMARLEGVAMRLETTAGINGCTLINDSYNLDLTALAAALSYLQRQPYPGRHTLILSDILQSGEPRPRLYAKVGKLVRDSGIGRFIGIGAEITALAPHLPPAVEASFFPDTDAFLAQQKHRDFRDEAILVKGARPFAFERIVRRLAGKVHQTELEVDLSALLHNLRVFQSCLEPTTRLMAMVKAAAYGSGSLEVARALEFHQVGYLAVAYADEGVELREGGISLPILVLNPEEAVFDSILRYGLEPELYSLRLLREFGRFTLEAGRQVPVHLKLETGMNRLGFDEDSLGPALELLARYPHLEVRSAFSHLAASEAPAHDAFTHQQAARYEALYAQLAAALGYRPLRHILNSSGIARFPQYQMDMVRLGIGIYGIGGGALQPQLQPALTLRARLSQIKTLAVGDTVGYGRSGRVNRPSRIATVSIGYADGLPRAAGQGRYGLLIHGQRAPIIGNVCMDMCMVDVTDIPLVAEGDTALVFGPGLPVEELAAALGTIPYEVLTSVSPRVRRVYVQE